MFLVYFIYLYLHEFDEYMNVYIFVYAKMLGNGGPGEKKS